jgi:hypothetical protein
MVDPRIELDIDRNDFPVERYLFPDGSVVEIRLYETTPYAIEPYRRAITRKRFFDAVDHARISTGESDD